MCNCSPHIALLHLVAIGFGCLLIAELARRSLRPAFFWAIVGTMSVLMFVFLYQISYPDEPFFDFVKAYWPAGEAALKSPSSVITLFEEGAESFVNIPVLAYLFAPFALAPPIAAAWVLTALGVVAMLAAWRVLSDLAGLDRMQSALLMFVGSAFGPLVYSTAEGNTSHILILALALGMAKLRQGREVMAGVLFGVAAIIKLPLLLVGVYFLLRMRWNVVLGGFIVCAGTGLLSLLIFGWDGHLAWYENSVAPYASQPLSAWNVQSISGGVLRLTGEINAAWSWDPRELTSLQQIVVTATSILCLSLAAFAVLAPRPAFARQVPGQAMQEVEFMLVIVLACVVSPLSWSHYYAWMIIPMAFFLGRTDHFNGGAATRWIGWTAFVLMSAPAALLMIDHPLIAQLIARFETSRTLIGGMLMLGLLVWSRWTMGSADRIQGSLSFKRAVSPG